MYKPAFCLLFLLYTTASALAQAGDGLMDTLVTVVQPAGDEVAGTTSFDPVGKQHPVALRTVPKRVVDSLKAAEEFWYANTTWAKKKEKKTPETGQSLFQKQWFRNLIWFLILSSFVGVVLWYLVASNIFIFRKKAKPLQHPSTATDETDNLFSLDYDREIATATTAGDYRLAVRLWYLQTLKLLAEKGLIHYRFERTNQDYIAQLSKHTCYREFLRLTRNFEYTWYGHFPLTRDVYAMMQDQFVQFQKSLRG